MSTTSLLSDFVNFLKPLDGVIKVPRWALTSNGRNYNLWQMVQVWAGSDTSKWKFMEDLVADQKPEYEWPLVLCESIICEGFQRSDAKFVQTHPLKDRVIRKHHVIHGSGKLIQLSDLSEQEFKEGDSFLIPHQYNEKFARPVLNSLSFHIVTFWAHVDAPKVWMV